MEIEWHGESAPEVENLIGTLIRAEGRCGEGSLKNAFFQAAGALGRNLAANGATPAHIERLTICVPDPKAFLDDLSELDLLYRESLGGNAGRVALTKSDADVRLEAQAVVPPPSNEQVFGGFTRAQLNKEYSPRATVPEAPEIMARWRTDGGAHQSRRTAELHYGSGSARGIDLYMPDSESRTRPPLHVYIHGGYWQALDKRDNGHLGASLVEAGIAFAAINYPLCPPASIGQIVEECRAALLCLYRNADTHGYDPARITVSGHSAGGHLAGMLAVTDWPAIAEGLPQDLIKGTVTISGLFDVEPLVHTGLNKALRLTVDQARTLSPVRLPVTTKSPVVAAVGGAESDEFRRQSREYTEWLLTQGIDATYLELPELNHFTAPEALTNLGSPLYSNVVELAFRGKKAAQAS